MKSLGFVTQLHINILPRVGLPQSTCARLHFLSVMIRKCCGSLSANIRRIYGFRINCLGVSATRLSPNILVSVKCVLLASVVDAHTNSQVAVQIVPVS